MTKHDIHITPENGLKPKDLHLVQIIAVQHAIPYCGMIGVFLTPAKRSKNTLYLGDQELLKPIL